MATSLVLHIQPTVVGSNRLLGRGSYTTTVPFGALVAPATDRYKLLSSGSHAGTAAATQPAPDGKGLLYDVALTGKTIVAGDWTIKLSLTASAERTGVLVVRAYIKNGSTYTLIGSATTAATIRTVGRQFSLAFLQPHPTATFGATTRLYLDVTFHATANYSTGTITVDILRTASSIKTPGTTYPTSTATLATGFEYSATATKATAFTFATSETATLATGFTFGTGESALLATAFTFQTSESATLGTGFSYEVSESATLGTGFYFQTPETASSATAFRFGPTGYIFSPPLLADTPPFSPESAPEQIGLWRHYKNRKRGVNVFILNDGTVMQTTTTPQTPTPTPTAMRTVNVPYPWNPYTPTSPYVRTINFTGTETDTTLTPRIKEVFWGGHETPVSYTTGQTLTKAGFGAYLTPTYT